MNRRSLTPASSRSVVPGFLPSGASFRVAFFAFAILSALAPAASHAQSAGKIYKQAQAAEAHEDYDTAIDLYQKALAKSPNDLSFKAALYRVRVSASSMHMGKARKLIEGGDEQGALTEYLHALEVDPSNEAAQQAIDKLRRDHEAKASGETSISQQPATASVGGPVILKPLSNEPLTLHYSEDAKVVYQAIGKAAGINVLFDPDYTPKRITVDLTSESLLDALRIVGTLSNTFWRPVTGNTIFVAQNTRQKRTDLEEQAVQTFYLTNAWQQNDLTDVQTAIRNVLGSTIKVYGVPSQNAIVVRGTPDELLLSQKLINDLDKARAGSRGGHCRARSEQELGAHPRHLVAQQRGHRTPGSVHHIGLLLDQQHQFDHEFDKQFVYDQSDPLRSGPSQGVGLCCHHRVRHCQSAADRFEYKDPAESAHPRHRRAKGHDEDRRAYPDSHRFLPDGRSHSGRQFARKHAVPPIRTSA